MSYFIDVVVILIAAAMLWRVGRLRAAHADQARPPAAGAAIGPVIPWLAVALIAILTLWRMAYQVPAGHVGIVYTFGGITGQRGEGLQWTAPWQDMIFASVRVQGHKFEKLSSFSLETQDVFVDATINIQVSPHHIQDLYRDVGPNYFDILVRPRVLQAFKDETVKYTSVNIAPNREAIRRMVRERLTRELETHSIAVQDLLIDNISFSGKFQDAIEEKQRQSQLALAEQEKVKGEKAKADQAIEHARGTAQAILINAEKQAEANQKLAQSITPEYIQYIFASKLAPNVNVMMVPTGQNFILNSDILRKPAQPAK